MKEILYSVDSAAIAVALLVSMGVVIELGYRIGLRKSNSAQEAFRSHVNTMAAALLGILALLLGFTLSLALQRFDSRSEAVVDEANAFVAQGSEIPKPGGDFHGCKILRPMVAPPTAGPDPDQPDLLAVRPRKQFLAAPEAIVEHDELDGVQKPAEPINGAGEQRRHSHVGGIRRRAKKRKAGSNNSAPSAGLQPC